MATRPSETVDATGRRHSRAASFGRYGRHAVKLLLATAVHLATVAQAMPPAATGGAMSEQDVGAWLLRLHNASRERDYVGTFVVSSASGSLASARIWHACKGEQQIERVESLTGTPRSVFRHNDRVLTLLPDRKVARAERRESLGAFPGLLKSLDATITDFYSARPAGSARVAGFDADVVELTPKDDLRFGYRVWSEKGSSLVVKVQTLDPKGQVLEQSAFSDLQLDAPVQIDKLEKMMEAPDGWRIETPAMVKTSASAMGWSLDDPVAGFKPVQCYVRALGDGGKSEPERGRAARAPEQAMHWVFSDGLASVSLFVEPFDSERHRAAGQMAMGATHTLTRRIGADARGGDGGEWWLTAVGEVPLRTLDLLGSGLKRVARTR